MIQSQQQGASVTSQFWPEFLAEGSKYLYPCGNYTRLNRYKQYELEYMFDQNVTRSDYSGMDISERLDAAMKAARFPSQSALARASGIPQPTINRILKGAGKQGPESVTVRKLAQACNCSFDWLNEGKGDIGRYAQVADPISLSLDELTELLNLFAMSSADGRRQIIRMATVAEKIGAIEVASAHQIK